MVLTIPLFEIGWANFLVALEGWEAFEEALLISDVGSTISTTLEILLLAQASPI